MGKYTDKLELRMKNEYDLADKATPRYLISATTFIFIIYSFTQH